MSKKKKMPSTGPKLEIYKGKDASKQNVRWRVRDGKTILARSEEPFKPAYKKHIKPVLQQACEKGKVSLWQDNKGKTRWRLLALNGEVVAISTKGHKEKKDAMAEVNALKAAAKSF